MLGEDLMGPELTTDESGERVFAIQKQPQREKCVMIAVVSYDHRVQWEVTHAIYGDILLLANDGWEVSLVFQGGGMDVPHARNSLFSDAYHGPFSDLVYIDSDISWDR